VLLSVTPGQQIVKIFHDELTKILGEKRRLSISIRRAHPYGGFEWCWENHYLSEACALFEEGGTPARAGGL